MPRAVDSKISDCSDTSSFASQRRDDGSLGDKKVEHSSKWKPLFIVLVVLGIGGIAIAGVGFAGLGASQNLWSLGLLNHLGQINSIVIMVPNAGIGILFLATGVAGLVKEQSYVFSLDEDEIFVDSIETRESNVSIEEEETRSNENDLSCFLAAMRTLHSSEISIDLDRHTYKISYENSSSTLKVQTNKSAKTLQVVLNGEEEIDSIRVNGLKTKQIPEIYSRVLEMGLNLVLRMSSIYELDEGDLSITVLRDSIKKIPEFHLGELVEKMRSSDEIEVDFHTDAQGTNDASDAGGPSREYLGLLFDAISESPLFCFERLPSGLVVPRTKKDYQNGRSLPRLAKEERLRFKQIGQVIMKCFESREGMTIGRHFEDALIRALLCLSSKEIDTPFRKLSFSTKLKMCSALLTDRDDEALYMERIKLLSQKKLNNSQLAKAAQIACLAECLPEDLMDDDEPDLQKIQTEENRERVLQALKDSLFGARTSYGQLGTQLATVHATARGAKRNRHSSWDSFILEVDFRKFSNEVQGTLSRKKIVDCIIIVCDSKHNAEITKKVGWLKNWILDAKNGATDREIRKFLKFVTGSQSLPAYEQIKVRCQNSNYSPIPKSSTCSCDLYLSPVPSGIRDGYNDFTKKDFIKTLRETALLDETFDFA